MTTLDHHGSEDALRLSEGAIAEAVARERRQIAVEVHDLVMQDLALALSAARTLLDEPAAASGARAVVLAGERALSGAREVIAQCSSRAAQPIAEMLGAAVRSAARGVPVRFDASGVGPGEQPDAPTRDALLHIGREAVTNAAKHGRPAAIDVMLARDEEWRLRVRDDGCGFVEGAGGFGVPSMRHAAMGLGGSLRVVSAPDAGTVVVAALP